MKYLMFVIADPTGEESTLDVEEWFDDLTARGVHLHGDRLRPVQDATTVRVRNGELLVTDGPFTESKEWIAGYDLLECESLDEAITVALRHPMAQEGAIEVREVWPLDLDEFPKKGAAL